MTFPNRIAVDNVRALIKKQEQKMIQIQNAIAAMKVKLASL